jgi:putative ABC transport system permease protein
VRLILGRDFQPGNDSGAIVNETFVSKFLSGRNPIGQTIGIKGCQGTPRIIVGVVANYIDRQRAVLAPMVYMPYPSRAIEPTTLALRTAGDPRPLIPTIRRIVAGLDTRIDGDVTTGVEYKESKYAQERLLSALLIGFGSIALGVCGLGIYGLLAYTVSRRTSEIGLRMALGARKADVIRLILHESLAPVAVGIVVGLSAALALTRLLESTLFGVSKHDPWTIAGAATLLMLTAGASAFVPARRASRIDPMTALRHE